MDFSSVIDEKIISATPLSGGDIGSSYRIVAQSREYFVKRYSTPGLPGKEARGLEAMAGTNTVTVPEVISFDEHFLVLGFIQQAPRCRDFQTRLGRELARLHRNAAQSFGFTEDNFIGSTPQHNSPKNSWIDFFLENRLDYQVGLSGDPEVAGAYRRLRVKLPELLGDSLGEPSLLHGDLWSGNVISGQSGEPVLIDPAAYYGNREAELGMTLLFGGFSEEFYRAYNSEFPLIKGWRSRMDIYKLYHVLNHLNMFGGGYKHQVLSLMNSY